jgi:hypothetical protein
MILQGKRNTIHNSNQANTNSPWNKRQGVETKWLQHCQGIQSTVNYGPVWNTTNEETRGAESWVCVRSSETIERSPR